MEHGDLGLGVEEAVDGEQQGVRGRGRGLRDPAERAEVLLGEGDTGLREQTGDRDDGLAQPADLGVLAVAGRDLRGGGHPVGTAAAQLVGTREDADRVHRGGVARLVAEGLEEVDVGGMEVPHEVEHRVGGRGPFVVAAEERFGARGDLGAQRSDAGRVDEGRPAQRRRGPLDDEPLDLVRRPGTQIDVERAGLAPEPHGLGEAVDAGRA